MGQATVPSAIEPMSSQPYFLKPLVPMELSEAKYLPQPHEPMKGDESKVIIGIREMAEKITLVTNEEEPTPFLGTLEGIDTEKIPRIDLQLVAEQLLNAESTEPEILH